jgi:hypothetical protein
MSESGRFHEPVWKQPGRSTAGGWEELLAHVEQDHMTGFVLSNFSALALAVLRFHTRADESFRPSESFAVWLDRVKAAWLVFALDEAQQNRVKAGELPPVIMASAARRQRSRYLKRRW